MTSFAVNAPMKSPNLIWPLCQRISGSRRIALIATSHEELKKISEHGGHLGECTVLLSVHVISSPHNLCVRKYSTAGGVCSSPAQCQLLRFNTISIWCFGIIGLARTFQKYQQASTPCDWQKFQNHQSWAIFEFDIYFQCQLILN